MFTIGKPRLAQDLAATAPIPNPGTVRNIGHARLRKRLRREKRREGARLVRKLFSIKHYAMLFQVRTYRGKRESREVQLQRLIDFCIAKVPYYRSLWAEPLNHQRFEFSKLPILSKEGLAQNFGSMVATHPSGVLCGQGPYWIVRTSGSTGVPSRYMKDRASVLSNIVCLTSIFEEHHIRRWGNLYDLGLHWPGQPIVQGRTFPGLFLCWNFSGHTFDTAEVREESLAIIACARPDIIYGMPSRIMALARLCEEQRITLRPRIVVSTYEDLTTAAETFLRASFSCPVVRIYGTAEIGISGWSCPQNRFHFDPRVVVVELVKENGEYAERGELGRIILTPLGGRIMPLVRFDTGDLATFPEHDCKCGRQPFSIEGLEGRRAAMVATAGGNHFSPYRIYGYIESWGISEFQLLQRQPGHLELVVPSNTLLPQSAIENLRLRISAYLEEDTEFTLSPGGAFVYTASGKRNTFVQDV